MTLTIHDELEQGSDQWLQARLGMVTASVVGRLINERTLGALDYDCPACDAPPHKPCMSKVKGAAGKPIKTVHSERSVVAGEKALKVLETASNDESRGLTAVLVAERITGWSDPSFVTFDMQRGNDCEPIARRLYSEKYAPATELGYMVKTFDNGNRLGFSPDGLVGDDGLIEIKSPRAKTHLMTVLSGEVPTYHLPQIQAGLLVSGRSWCDFVSFYGGLPLFVKRVHADPRWHEAIIAALNAFEESAAQMVADFASATTGLAQTERVIELEMIL